MLFRMLLAGALAAAGLSACAGDRSSGTAATAGTVPLTVESPGRFARFRVEVARTEAEQARGLMFRTKLAPDGGMIFPMDPPRVASFWMKNTVIPLDMIFIRADGTIARIAENTEPYSLDPVTSGEPVAAVLEVAGGRAGELGISEGDKVNWQR